VVVAAAAAAAGARVASCNKQLAAATATATQPPSFGVACLLFAIINAVAATTDVSTPKSRVPSGMFSSFAVFATLWIGEQLQQQQQQQHTLGASSSASKRQAPN